MDDTTTIPTDDRHIPPRAKEGLDHLQAAARELIEAARAMLDVAEDMVNDPETVASVVGAVTALGDLVRQKGSAGPAPGRQPGGAAGDGSSGSGIERIPVL